MENVVRFALLILLTVSRPSSINAKTSCVVPNKKIFCKIRTEIQNSVELLERSKFDFCLCTHVVVGLEKFKNKLQVDRNQNELFRYLGRKRATDAAFPKIMASIGIGDDFNPEKLKEEVQFLLGRIDLDGVELDYDSNNTRLILPVIKNVRSNATNKIITMSLSAKLMNSTQIGNFKEITRYLNMVVIQPIFYSYAKINKNKEDFRRISDLETLASVIDDVLSWGIPKHKVLVTLSTFGIRTELNPSTGSIKSSIRIPYSEICIDRRDKNWILQREMDQTSPFILKENIRQAFDDEISLKLKSKYILLRKLGGVQISSIHEDDHSDFCKRGHYPLIRSIHHVISGVKSNKSSIDDLQEYMEPSETKIFLKRSGELPPDDLPCSRVGYYQNPYDCNKFYRCVKFHPTAIDFTIFHYECPRGLIFDERYEVCNWPSWSDRCAGSGEIVNVPKNRFVCPGTGYFRDRENCRWFYYCSEVYYDNDVPSAYEFKCPYNLAYDEEKHICNWRWLVPGCGLEISDKWNSQSPFLPKELGVIYEKPEKDHRFIDHDFDKFLKKPGERPLIPIDPDFDKFQQKPDKPIIAIDPDVDKLVFDNPNKGSIIPGDPDIDKLVHFSKFNKPVPEPEPEPDPEPEPKFKHPPFKPPNLSTGFNLGKNKDFIPDSNPFEGIGKLSKPFDETFKKPKPEIVINPLFGIPDHHHLTKPNYPSISHHTKVTTDHSHHSSFDRMRNLFHGLFSLITTRVPTISIRNILSQGIVSHLSKLFSGHHHHDSLLTIPLLEEKTHSTSLQPPPPPPVNIFIINNGNKFEKITPHILTPEKLPHKPLIKQTFKEYVPPPVEPEPPIKDISPPIEPEPPIKDIPPPIKPEPPIEEIPPPEEPEPPIKELPPPKRPEKQIYYGPPDILPLPPRPETVKPIIPPQSEEFKSIRPRPIKYYNQEQYFPDPPARPEPKPNKYFPFKDTSENIPPEPEPVQFNKYENDCKDDKEIPPFSKFKYEKFEEISARPPLRPERIPLPPKYENNYESKSKTFPRPEPDPEIIPQLPKYKFHSYEGITQPHFRPEPEPKDISYLSKFQNYDEIPPKSFPRPVPEDIPDPPPKYRYQGYLPNPEPLPENIPSFKNKFQDYAVRPDPIPEDNPSPPKFKYQSHAPKPEPLPENIPSFKNKFQDYVVRPESIPEDIPSPPKFKYESYVPRPESTPDEILPIEKQVRYHNYKEKLIEQRPDPEDIPPELDRYKYKTIPEKPSKGQYVNDKTENRYPPTDREIDPGFESINELGPKFELDYYSKTACTRPGLFRHPGNCYKFYECYWDKWINKFTLHMFDCPIKLIFDEKILGCSSPKVNIPCKGYK